MSEVIDWAHLDRQTMGEPAIAKEVLHLFVRHLDEGLVSLRVDDADLADNVHKLKGSARGVGAWYVAEIAERFSVAQEDQLGDLQALKEAMRAAREMALQKLAELSRS
ncbi:MAG: Hpt domain-containing protein [Cohaesibacter sp.]|nr:Hpt domain-containing protein [Cohaesibacter sp.]